MSERDERIMELAQGQPVHFLYGVRVGEDIARQMVGAKPDAIVGYAVLQAANDALDMDLWGDGYRAARSGAEVGAEQIIAKRAEV